VSPAPTADDQPTAADEALEIDWGADEDPDPDGATDDELLGSDSPADPADRAGDAADEPGDQIDEPATLPGPAEATSTADLADAVGEPRWSARDRTRERALLATVAELPEDDPRRAAARDEIVTMHLPLASFLARRFRDRGESIDDLTQVATIGLLKAVDRFDPERGVEFSTFATPTMVGEIKRHFRDKGWAIRVPRRLQELRISISRATAELSQSSGRSPTVAELAAHLGVTEDEVLEGLESAQAYATLSLDATVGDGTEEGTALADTLGEHDPKLAEVEARQTVDPLLGALAPRERAIVQMRFYENLTQAQIAERVGISQMHVSRLLAKSLAQMRTSLAEGPD
jgi:RNA polymerase sigma-B factor